MAALRAFALTIACLWATSAAADPVSRWQSYTREAALRFDIPQRWIERVLGRESGGMTVLQGLPITSRAGAMGLMQLMPGTWAAVRALLRLGRDPYDPRDNILAGAFYLRRMYERFGYPGLFAAYNAGPARYSAYLAGRSDLPRETRAYVTALAPAAVAASVQPLRRRDPAPPDGAVAVPRPSRLFALREAGSESAEPSVAGRPAALFVPLSHP